MFEMDRWNVVSHRSGGVSCGLLQQWEYRSQAAPRIIIDSHEIFFHHGMKLENVTYDVIFIVESNLESRLVREKFKKGNTVVEN